MNMISIRIVAPLLGCVMLCAAGFGIPPAGGIIGVSGNGVLLAQGNDPASDTDAGTNFGIVQQGVTAHPHVFALHNLGSTGGALKVNSVTVTGTNASDFFIAVPPENLNVGRGAIEPYVM